MADMPNDDSGDGPTPPYGHHSERRPAAPVHAPPTLALIDRRVRETATESIGRVDILRSELKAHLLRQDGVLAGMKANIDMMMRQTAIEQRERSAIRIAANEARIEVQKTGEIALIDEAAERKKHQRGIVLKVMSLIVTLLTGYLLGGGHP